jgi:Flp pilus assembly CpaE family ATPase
MGEDIRLSNHRQQYNSMKEEHTPSKDDPTSKRSGSFVSTGRNKNMFGARGDTGGGILANNTARKNKLMESEVVFDLKCNALVDEC